MSNLSPVEKQQQQAYNRMSKPLQEVAQFVKTKLATGQQGVILIQYDIGARLREVTENEGEYGPMAMTKLAAYLNVPGREDYLNRLVAFAKAFTNSYVKQWCPVPLKSGTFLELTHWLLLARLKDHETRHATLQRVISQSMSTRDLEMYIRNSGNQANVRRGGRKPVVPDGALAILHKAFNMTVSTGRFLSSSEDKLFERLDSLDDNEITPGLRDRLEKSVQVFRDAEAKLHDVREKTERALARVKKTIDERYEEQTKDMPDAEEDESRKPAAKKTQQTASRKPSSAAGPKKPEPKPEPKKPAKKQKVTA